jgi:ethanolamine utilization microcompartment shell protein EutS
MLSGKLLNSDATLNNFREISSLSFIPGEQVTLKIRIWNPELDIRYIPLATVVSTFTFVNSDGDLITKTGSHDADDRSIVSVTLEEVDTAVLLGGNISFSLDTVGDGSIILKGVIINALSRVITDDC